MIRINGCSIYEDPAFYDACDRAGILVWQDFMLTVANYPGQRPRPSFLYRLSPRLKSPSCCYYAITPSLALWCGDNETVWILAELSLLKLLS